MDFFVTIKKTDPREEEIIENDLLVHRYIPKKFSEFKIHQNIAKKINNILENNDILNLYLYGPSGSGKYILAKSYINTYYQSHCKLELKTFKKDTKEIDYYQSNNHYEIVFNNYNFNDLNLVRSFMENIVNKGTQIFGNKKNIILIKNTDILKDNVFKILRFYIEKYYLFNIFIVISEKKNIKYANFFCLVRVPSPTNEEITILCKDICKKECIKIRKLECEEIVKLANRNISNLKNIIEYSFINDKYEKYIDPCNDKLKFLYKVIKKKNMNTLFLVRELLYELLVENIEPNIILRYLLCKYKKEYVSQKMSYEKFLDIIKILKDTSHKIAIGLRPIVNLECCIIEIIDLL